MVVFVHGVAIRTGNGERRPPRRSTSILCVSKKKNSTEVWLFAVLGFRRKTQASARRSRASTSPEDSFVPCAVHTLLALTLRHHLTC